MFSSASPARSKFFLDNNYIFNSLAVEKKSTADTAICVWDNLHRVFMRMISNSCRHLRASSRKANGQSQDFIHILSEMRILTEPVLCVKWRERKKSKKNLWRADQAPKSSSSLMCSWMWCGIISWVALTGERRRKIFTFQSTKKTLELDAVLRWLHSFYFSFRWSEMHA